MSFYYLSLKLLVSCFCSVTKSCPAVCDPMDCSMPGFPVLYHLLEFAQTHDQWADDAIQPSYPLSPPSPFAFNLSRHQDLFQCVRWPKHWSFSISPSNEYSELISFRMDWLELLAVQGTQESSPTPQFKGINSPALSFLYGPALTSTDDY